MLFRSNPIEIGTGGYFLFIGIWFDGLLTGLLCQLFGMILGYGYIKLIEERELSLRFGEPYKEYLASTPLFVPSLFGKGRAKHDWGQPRESACCGSDRVSGASFS